MYRTLTLIFPLLIAITALISCQENNQISSIDPINWEQRRAKWIARDSMESGTTYLSVYSQIYSQTEHRTHDLTVTVSMRNTSRTDTVYLKKAEYFNTQGNSIRSYFDHSVFLAPMETVEIIIDERDQEGGTGANFLFDWSIPSGGTEPIFEGVMISTSGSQGLSFVTKGLRVE